MEERYLRDLSVGVLTYLLISFLIALFSKCSIGGTADRTMAVAAATISGIIGAILCFRVMKGNFWSLVGLCGVLGIDIVFKLMLNKGAFLPFSLMPAIALGFCIGGFKYIKAPQAKKIKEQEAASDYLKKIGIFAIVYYVFVLITGSIAVGGEHEAGLLIGYLATYCLFGFLISYKIMKGRLWALITLVVILLADLGMRVAMIMSGEGSRSVPAIVVLLLAFAIPGFKHLKKRKKK